MDDRLADLPPPERDERIGELHAEALTQLSEFSHRVARVQLVMWIAILGLTVAIAVGAYVEAGHHQSRINEIERVARNVDQHVNANTATIAKWRTEQLLRNEKVCTESNRGEPCRALFERLSKDLTPRQQRIMACGVLEAIAQTPAVVRLQRMSLCHRFQVVDTPP